MTPWWGKVSGDTWLRVAVLFWLLSLLSGFLAWAAGFNFDPNDYSSDYYAAQVPRLMAVTVVAVLIPAASAAASVLSIRATPGRPSQIAPAMTVLILSLCGVCLCLTNGINAVQQAAHFAEHSPM